MESAVGKNTITDDPPPEHHDAGTRNGQQEFMAAFRELCRFLLDGLDDAQRVLGLSLTLQHEMMDVISRRMLRPGCGGHPGLDAEGMHELVTAMQSDDLARQRHEDLGRALAVMSMAVREVRDLAGTAPGRRSPADVPGGRWTAVLQKTLILEEMRQGFAREPDIPSG